MQDDISSQSTLPLYRDSIDWARFSKEYPAPDLYEAGMFRWSRDRMRALQNERFLRIMEIGWRTPFYVRRWKEAGIEPGDVRSLDDIGKLPSFTSDDIKTDQQENPPYGSIHSEILSHFPGTPLKLQTSGGTTGKPRPTLYGPLEWELMALTAARAMYIQGARPGDVMQHPGTNALACYPWSTYKACHDYLGILPITTGSGLITPSRRQLEIAEDWGTTIWQCFPEYLTQLAKVYRDEFGKDVRDLPTKFIASFLGPDVDDSLRKDVEALWGAPVYDNYGTHETGFAAFECQAKEGLHLHEDVHHFEVEDVETGLPCADGQAGNLVVTSLYRQALPLIRFNMRDLARITHSDRCSCGGATRRMDKFLGRSDDMVKIRGVNIYPMACLAAVKSDERTTGEWFCIADRSVRDGVIRDEMLVQIETRSDAAALDGLKEALEKRLNADLGLKIDVELVPEGGLADATNVGREGKPRRLLDKRNKSVGIQAAPVSVE